MLLLKDIFDLVPANTKVSIYDGDLDEYIFTSTNISKIPYYEIIEILDNEVVGIFVEENGSLKFTIGEIQ